MGVSRSPSSSAPSAIGGNSPSSNSATRGQRSGALSYSVLQRRPICNYTRYANCIKGPGQKKMGVRESPSSSAPSATGGNSPPPPATRGSGTIQTKPFCSALRYRDCIPPTSQSSCGFGRRCRNGP
ncbi:hypothetical protein ACH5RR_036079 [Cinchona calisaya]|uniref:Uncharacterized protein n=1 Tax=Cinchona calisaya TaxID=153742 RepID=A0ABD2Y630_9GENT